MRRALCIVADDFGLHAGIAGATARLVAMGRVHAVGCMVGGVAWRESCTLLAGFEPAVIDVGLHLDLSERPLQGRRWRRLPALWAASGLRQIDVRGLRTTVCAQLDAFESAIGRPPAFVDGHLHVHQLPVVREQLLQELRLRYGARRPWLRSTRSPLRPLPMQFKRWVVARLGMPAFERQARQQGFGLNRHLLGIYDFDPTPGCYARHLARWLAACGDGDLLMCHPGMGAADGIDHSAARCAEYHALSGADFADALAREGIVLQALSRTLAPLRLAEG